MHRRSAHLHAVGALNAGPTAVARDDNAATAARHVPPRRLHWSGDAGRLPSGAFSPLATPSGLGKGCWVHAVGIASEKPEPWALRSVISVM